jgi:hypothetical protein
LVILAYGVSNALATLCVDVSSNRCFIDPVNIVEQEKFLADVFGTSLVVDFIFAKDRQLRINELNLLGPNSIMGPVGGFLQSIPWKDGAAS